MDRLKYALSTEDPYEIAGFFGAALRDGEQVPEDLLRIARKFVDGINLSDTELENPFYLLDRITKDGEDSATAFMDTDFHLCALRFAGYEQLVSEAEEEIPEVLVRFEKIAKRARERLLAKNPPQKSVFLQAVLSL